LSTRENGVLSMAHPTLSDCNYVIGYALIDGKQVLLDATEPSLQAGILPLRCLNGEGHLINNDTSESVKLSNPKSGENITVSLEIVDGKISGQIGKRESGMSAFDFRKSVKIAGGKKEHFEKLRSSSPEISYLSYKYSNLDSLLSEPVFSEYKFELKDKQESNTDLIYLDPIVIERQKTNPFTSPTREYPVDFGSLVTQYYFMQCKIPQGYVVEDIPKNVSISLEDRGGQFLYQISRTEQSIMVNMVVMFNKTLFLPEEYPSLKNFFDLMINKQSEQIVLKKKSA
jgi:hypothetical protein